MLTPPVKSLVYFEHDKLSIADDAFVRSQIDATGASAQLCVQV